MQFLLDATFSLSSRGAPKDKITPDGQPAGPSSVFAGFWPPAAGLPTKGGHSAGNSLPPGGKRSPTLAAEPLHEPVVGLTLPTRPGPLESVPDPTAHGRPALATGLSAAGGGGEATAAAYDAPAETPPPETGQVRMPGTAGSSRAVPHHPHPIATKSTDYPENVESRFGTSGSSAPPHPRRPIAPGADTGGLDNRTPAEPGAAAALGAKPIMLSGVADNAAPGSGHGPRTAFALDLGRTAAMPVDVRSSEGGVETRPMTVGQVGAQEPLRHAGATPRPEEPSARRLDAFSATPGAANRVANASTPTAASGDARALPFANELSRPTGATAAAELSRDRAMNAGERGFAPGTGIANVVEQLMAVDGAETRRVLPGPTDLRRQAYASPGASPGASRGAVPASPSFSAATPELTRGVLPGAASARPNQGVAESSGGASTDVPFVPAPRQVPELSVTEALRAPSTPPEATTGLPMAAPAGAVSNSAAPSLDPLAAATARTGWSILDLPVGFQPAEELWGTAIGERLLWMADKRIGQAQIRLHPAHLGPVSVEIDTQDRGAVVTFTAPNHAVRESLEAALPRLREMFEQAGLSLSDASVRDEASGSSGNGAHAGDAARLAADPHNLPGESIAEGAAQPQGSPGDGIIDTYV